ncbi:hypothetical protein D1007_11005 [Hordeum vulgare]|nr:hypothetical protein D1007_11005 [Hordeum vulgare]
MGRLRKLKRHPKMMVSSAHKLLVMDSWSKENYSRHVQEESMVVEKLPEVNPPSDRVPGRGLLTLPISEALQR